MSNVEFIRNSDGAAVEDFGDVGMVHQRQGLAFGLEAGHDLPRVHAQLDNLERDAAMHGFLLLRHPDHAHAAFADLFEQFVAADAVAGLLGEQVCSAGFSRFGRWAA
jgi:hypothetical protein